ncbi:MAG: DinB family protein [Pyrinomonadaceae bacterium]|jgi:hypothetical protein|nr:DinB family protein [Pyrinomonadaceae bacterium]
MNYQTISEIYEANAKVREKLKQTIANLTDEQINFRPNETSWTINEIVEHIAIVENGMAKICGKLLSNSAENNLGNDGKTFISAEFLQKAGLIANRRERKAQAPERVLPSGNLSISESFAKMDENAQIFSAIREGLEKTNTKDATFPHPFFGDLNATEWLALAGGHEVRHIDQINEILEIQSEKG